MPCQCQQRISVYHYPHKSKDTPDILPLSSMCSHEDSLQLLTIGIALGAKTPLKTFFYQKHLDVMQSVPVTIFRRRHGGNGKYCHFGTLGAIFHLKGTAKSLRSPRNLSFSTKTQSLPCFSMNSRSSLATASKNSSEMETIWVIGKNVLPNKSVYPAQI